MKKLNGLILALIVFAIISVCDQSFSHTNSVVQNSASTVSACETSRQSKKLPEKTEVSDAGMPANSATDNGKSMEKSVSKTTEKNDSKRTQVASSKSKNRKNYRGGIYYSGDPGKKQVALTFDDGPAGKYTTGVLDILKKENVKATFFVIGSNAKKYPDIVKRMKTEGHAIGNHSWSHKNMSKLSAEKIKNEINRTESAIDTILGNHIPIFRPPYGSTNPGAVDVMHSMGYKVVNWSVDTRDWAGTSVPKMMEYVKKQLYDGGIILQHCSGKKQAMENTMKLLPQIITYCEKEGYEFVTIPEMLDVK